MKTTQRLLPETVNYHLNKNCNFRCRGCYAVFDDNPHARGVMLSKERMFDLVEAIAAAPRPTGSTRRKLTFAGGEPTLCPWLPELIAHAKASGLVTMVVTNGSRCDTDYLKRLSGVLDWLTLSIDSLDPDTLVAHGQLLGYVLEGTVPDSMIVLFPYYGVGMSSYPQITIDDNDNIFVIWSGLTILNLSPDGYNYRHIWSRASQDLGQTWGDMTDLNGSILYMYREFVFPSMAKNTTTNDIHFIYQSADIPGSSIKDANIAVHDNTIEYRKEPKETVIGIDLPSAIQQSIVSQNYPNPFHSSTKIDVTLTHNASLSLYVTDLIGHQVLNQNRGEVSSGIHSFYLNGSMLRSGVYFYTVVINGERFTKKMIVK